MSGKGVHLNIVDEMQRIRCGAYKPKDYHDTWNFEKKRHDCGIDMKKTEDLVNEIRMSIALTETKKPSEFLELLDHIQDTVQNKETVAKIKILSQALAWYFLQCELELGIMEDTKKEFEENRILSKRLSEHDELLKKYATVVEVNTKLQTHLDRNRDNSHKSQVGFEDHIAQIQTLKNQLDECKYENQLQKQRISEYDWSTCDTRVESDSITSLKKAHIKIAKYQDEIQKVKHVEMFNKEQYRKGLKIFIQRDMQAKHEYDKIFGSDHT